MSDDLPNEPELKHAMDVLRAASVDPDSYRRERVYAATRGTGSILYLWPLAAGVAACFIVGLGVLIFVAIGGGVHQPQIAHTNTASNIAKPANTATDAPGSSTQTTQSGNDYERPVWISKQADALGNMKVGLGGGSATGGGSSGGAPAGGGAGELPAGGSKLDKVRAAVDFDVFALPTNPGVKLESATVARSEKTGAGFDIVTLKYAGAESVLVLQAATTDESRRALSADGLELNAVTVELDGTVVLLMSDKASTERLTKLGDSLSK